MQQPEHLLRAQTPTFTPRRLVSLGVVGALHVLVILGFASGLAHHLVEKLPTDIIAKVETPKLPDVKPPPPPPPDLQKPPPPFVPPPDIVIQQEAPSQNTITVQHQVATLPPPKPAEHVGITAPALISGGAKCQTSYYPPIAIRLNQEGTTTVKVHVDASGEVSGVDVVSSSGHDSLDNAAVKCVTAAWHFKPAMENGSPVATTKEYNIKWQLQ